MVLRRNGGDIGRRFGEGEGEWIVRREGESGEVVFSL